MVQLVRIISTPSLVFALLDSMDLFANLVSDLDAMVVVCINVHDCHKLLWDLQRNLVLPIGACF